MNAAADGVVKEVTHSSKGLGNVVSIDHGNGYLTRYAHLENTQVSKGQKVTRGQKIGQVGMSGNSFAPHLHYEVFRDTLRMDPLNYLSRRSVRMTTWGCFSCPPTQDSQWINKQINRNINGKVVLYHR